MSNPNPLQVALPLGDGTWVVPGNRVDLLDARTASPPPEVSVVIPYYMQQARLDLVLTALADQTHPSSRLEVVIADDGSPQPPRVPPEAAGLRVTVVRQDDRGFRPAAARNLGVRTATGSVLCFLDGDTVPEPSYVHRASRLPALLPDAVVTGRRRHANLSGWTPARLRAWWRGGVEPPPELAEPAWLRELSAGLGRGAGGVTDSSFRAVISAVLICGRSLFSEVGGFDETFTRYGGEDWELAHRLFTAGAVLAHEPRAVAWHDGPDWAGRNEHPDEAAAQKAAEAAELAARVPEPALRRGVEAAELLGAPDVVARAGGADPATVRVLLGLGDVGIWTGRSAERVATGSSDPRVHNGEPPTAVLARARTVLDVRGGLALSTAELAGLIARVRPGGVGRLGVEPGVLQVTATRALGRARRHHRALGMDTDQALAALFGVEEVRDEAR